MPKSATILIDPNDLSELKKGKYKLCFAKKVNDSFNVVWQSYGDYLHSNMFSWTPAYQMFGSNTFSGSVTVSVATNVVNISLGEQCTLDATGNLGQASSWTNPLAMKMTNNFGPIHPGLNSISIGPDGIQTTTPIYVARDAIVSGSDTLTPIDTVQVWFEQNVVTSTVISDAVSNAVEIDLTDDDTATRLYSNGVWTTPPSKSAVLADPKLYLSILVTGTAALTAALLAKQLGTYLTGVYQSLTVQVDPTGKNGFKIAYSEKKELSQSDARFLQAVLDMPGSVDDLTQKTLQGLAALGSQFTEFDVTAG
jgi:hypothetical protein